MSNNIPKNRLFKWIGGKGWLKDTLFEISSNNVKNQKTYIEPFAGGLGSFLAIYPNLNNIDRLIINDINSLIIETYKRIKENPNHIIDKFLLLEDDFYKTLPEEVYKYHKTNDKEILKELLVDSNSFFMKIRVKFNELKFQEVTDETIAVFLFLTEHAFNGVYRENSKGGYNVPFNWDNKRQNRKTKKNSILAYHDFFNSIDIIFENMDVFDLMDKYDTKDTIIYLDPPYLNETIGENKYSKDHFTKEDQIKLLEKTLKYDNFIYSNHFTPTIIEFFDKNNIKYDKVARKNIMSSSSESRKNDIFEILAYR